MRRVRQSNAIGISDMKWSLNVDKGLLETAAQLETVQCDVEIRYMRACGEQDREIVTWVCQLC
jgi:hypothetical protein